MLCGRRIIRNQETVNLGSQDVEIIQNRHQTAGNSQTKLEIKKLFNKKSVIIYSSVFVALVAGVALGFNTLKTTPELNAIAGSSDTVSASAPQVKVALVDKTVEANVVAGLAETANLPVAANAAELSVSLSVVQNLSQDGDIAVIKPQTLETVIANQSVKHYTIAEGDTYDSIAAANGITARTVKWANGIKNDDVEVGKEIKLLPVDGVVCTAQEGETVDQLAEKYGASAERITSFNNLELATDLNGRELVIPDGILPEKDRPEYEPPTVAAVTTTVTGYQNGGTVRSSYRSNLSASVGNRYAYGYCTWWAYERRAQIGRPIGSFWGNATSWASSGAASGFAVNRSPAVGAIMQNGGGYGHVAVVESVNADGSIEISEMNGPAGWNVIARRTIPAGQVGSYNYIH